MTRRPLLSISLPLFLAPVSLAQEPFDLVVRDVDLFDARRGRVIEDRTVCIRDGLVVEVLDAEADVEAEKRIEGAGRLAVPGFVDTHAHLQVVFERPDGSIPDRLEPEEDVRAELARLYLDHGTTTIVDMGMTEAWLDQAVAWQHAPRSDWPNLWFVGSSLNSTLPWDTSPPPHHLQLAGPDEARAKVAAYADLGLEHLKLYWKLLEPEMRAVVETARERGLRTYAHMDNNIATMETALELGVVHYEHFFTLIPGVLDLDSHRPFLNRRFDLRDPGSIDEFSASLAFFFAYVRANEELELELMTLLERIAQDEGSISTALHVVASAAGRTDVFTSFNPHPVRTGPDLPYYTDAHREALSTAFDTMLEFVVAAHELGVTLRIGTDCKQGGRALLGEIALLVEAGIPMREALQIATWNGAKALGLEDRVGTIEPGRRADVVLFERSPLDDPAHLFGGKTVVKGGRVHVPASEPR